MSNRSNASQNVIHAVAVSYPLNAGLCVAHVALNTFVLFAFPLMGLPRPEIALCVVLAVSLTSNSLFSVFHEAIHRSLGPTTRVPIIGISFNDLMGRVIGICFGSPFHFVASAHITHHSVNRTHVEHPDLLEDAIGSKERRSFLLGYYFFLLGGLYQAELLVPLVLCLPRKAAQWLLARAFPADSMPDQALRRIYRSRSYLRAIRLDEMVIVITISLSAALYGSYWWILLCHFAVRAFLISFLDYLYHYASPLGDRLHGYNLKLPPVLSVAILNFNYHGIHHRFPSLPWRALRHVFNDEALVFDNHYVAQAVLQLKGPLTRDGLQKLMDRRAESRRVPSLPPNLP